VGRADEDAGGEALALAGVVAGRSGVLVGAGGAGDGDAGEVLVALAVAVVVDAVALLDQHRSGHDVGERRLDLRLRVGEARLDDAGSGGDGAVVVVAVAGVDAVGELDEHVGAAVDLGVRAGGGDAAVPGGGGAGGAGQRRAAVGAQLGIGDAAGDAARAAEVLVA